MEQHTVALVTGANKGIGFEIARQLSAAGITVLLGVRDLSRGADAAAKLTGVRHPIFLDVTDNASIDAAAKQIGERFGRLDILVNNAGILAGWGPPSEVRPAEMRAVYETNVFGVVAVTNAMLPLLRESPAGRIVNISSEMGSLETLGAPGGGIPLVAYSSSKTALNALTVAYALELVGSTVKINSADPGYCATDLNGHTGPRTPAQGAAIAVRLATLPPDGPTGAFLSESQHVPW